MARQKGIVKLLGSIADFTFYKTENGYFAKEKSGVSGERIATDPLFQRTRENGAEFGRAGKAAKLFRTAFNSVSRNASDSSMRARLMKYMMKVIQADATNARGLRNVIDGEAELLQGFEFNTGGRLDTTFKAPYTSTITRASGELKVVINGFIPQNMIYFPQGATHYRFIMAGVLIDFEKNTYLLDDAGSAELHIDNVATAALTLTANLTPAATSPLFIAFGIEFYQEVNGEMYPLKNGAYNGLSLVKVDGGV